MSGGPKADERSFSWLCKSLASSKVPFRLLQTVFFRNDKVDCTLGTTTGGSVKRGLGQDFDFLSLPQVLSYFQGEFVARKQVRDEPAGVCYCKLRGHRFLITPELLSEIEDRHMNISHCSFLQECRSGPHMPYTCEVTWRDGAYLPQYRVGKREGTSEQMLHKLTDCVKVVLEVVRQLKHRAVVDLSVDFHRTAAGEFWLCDGRRCVLGDALMLEHWTVEPQSVRESFSISEEEPRNSVRTSSIVPKRNVSQRTLGYYNSDFQELLLRMYLRDNNLDVELLAQPALLKDFERRYNIDATQSASSSRSVMYHTRNFSDTADRATTRPNLPAIRKFPSDIPAMSSRKSSKAKQGFTL